MFFCVLLWCFRCLAPLFFVWRAHRGVVVDFSTISSGCAHCLWLCVVWVCFCLCAFFLLGDYYLALPLCVWWSCCSCNLCMSSYTVLLLCAVARILWCRCRALYSVCSLVDCFAAAVRCLSVSKSFFPLLPTLLHTVRRGVLCMWEVCVCVLVFDEGCCLGSSASRRVFLRLSMVCCRHWCARKVKVDKWSCYGKSFQVNW